MLNTLKFKSRFMHAQVRVVVLPHHPIRSERLYLNINILPSSTTEHDRTLALASNQQPLSGGRTKWCDQCAANGRCDECKHHTHHMYCVHVNKDYAHPAARDRTRERCITAVNASKTLCTKIIAPKKRTTLSASMLNKRCCCC